jgi:hypothetical protein
MVGDFPENEKKWLSFRKTFGPWILSKFIRVFFQVFLIHCDSVLV